MPVAVTGLQNLNRAFARAEKTVRLEWRRNMRRVAEPTRAAAEGLAASRIRNMAGSPAWGRMRVGVTQKVVYVAPRQRGTRGRSPGGRPKFADMLMDRAMTPALERHQAQVIHDFERLLDSMAREWER